MGAMKDLFIGEVETVGAYLTDNNAHFARAILDWCALGDEGIYTPEEMEMAYKIGQKFLAIAYYARLEKIAPNFQSLFTEMQDFAIDRSNELPRGN